MPRTIELSVLRTKIEDTDYLAIARTLIDPSGAKAPERAKGGLWVALDGDADAVQARLTHARDIALAFAVACDATLAELAAPKAPKPARKPTQAPPPAPTAAQNPAQPSRKDGRVTDADRPAAPSPAVAANRAIAIANARANKPAPVPAPAPAKAPASLASFTAVDWANLIGA